MPTSGALCGNAMAPFGIVFCVLDLNPKDQTPHKRAQSQGTQAVYGKLGRR